MSWSPVVVDPAPLNSQVQNMLYNYSVNMFLLFKKRFWFDEHICRLGSSPPRLAAWVMDFQLFSGCLDDKKCISLHPLIDESPGPRSHSHRSLDFRKLREDGASAVASQRHVTSNIGIIIYIYIYYILILCIIMYMAQCIYIYMIIIDYICVININCHPPKRKSCGGNKFPVKHVSWGAPVNGGLVQ